MFFGICLLNNFLLTNTRRVNFKILFWKVEYKNILNYIKETAAQNLKIICLLENAIRQCNSLEESSILKF